jgi:choline dehydrogenase-like flavoprotein
MADWDYIIVGAGSTGCVLAERLSADRRSRVLVLEAGGENRNFWVTLPKGVAKLVTRPEHIWAYQVTQSRFPGGPADEVWIRGKGLGGSSSINGMIWSRGEPADYDAWEASGCTGWNNARMVAAFRQLEDHALGASDLRGAGGPIHVDPAIYSYPLANRMIETGEALGLKRVAELNDAAGPRIGLYSHNIRNGRRQSAAVAFLEPARKRPNVRIVTQATAERILFADGRAIAVEAHVNGRPERFDCAGEIVISGGAIETPLLLQRSGVGDAERLRAAGIAPVVHAPNVGERMIEHLAFAMPHRLKQDVGTNRSFYGLGLARAMLRYALTRDGIMATGPFEVGAFANVANPDGRTDLQLYLGGYTFALSDDNHPVPLNRIDRRPGVTIYGQLLRLTSEGSIRVRGPGIGAAPEITPNWLSTEQDQRSAIAAVRYMRRFMAQAPLASLVGEELLPGREVQNDDAVLDAFRRLATCGLHGIGSCRMGGEESSPLDPRLRVRGVRNLRVADCSAMPGHVTGNTNAPAMALGLIAAEQIHQDVRR